jgi:hypothetical protein
MSLFDTMKEDLEKYQPQLIKVKLLGKIRSGETDEGNVIISMQIDDKKQLPVNEDRLKSYPKRICFRGEKTARHYIDHPDGDPKKKIFIMPMIQPSDDNQYWIRTIFPEPTEEEEKK